MNGRDLVIPVNGASMGAYLTTPDEGSGPHPAVIILGEVFGFTPEVKRIADLVTTIGYVGLAIDYYHRIKPGMNEPYTEDGSRNAFAAAAQLQTIDLIAYVRETMNWLNQQPFVKPGKIALWGFGFGATVAFSAATIPQISGAILFYPASVPLERATDVAVPLLIAFGEDDFYMRVPEIERLHLTLLQLGKDVRTQIYPKVGHSFFRYDRPEAVVEHHKFSDEAVAQAVADSWNLVQAFLRDVFNRPQRSADATDGIHTERKQQLQP